MKFRNLITTAAIAFGTVTLGGTAQAMDTVTEFASSQERGIYAEIERLADYQVGTVARVVEFNNSQQQRTADAIAEVAAQQRGRGYVQSASTTVPSGTGEI